MTKLLASLFCIVALFAISICSMIFGWGLEPRSWPWIIGCLFGVMGVQVVLKAIE